MSTSRSPGRPIASGSTVPSGWRSLTTTFFNVSAAVQSRSGWRSAGSALTKSTSVAIVGVSGVSWTTAAGSPSNGIAGGAGVTTASTLAA